MKHSDLRKTRLLESLFLFSSEFVLKQIFAGFPLVSTSEKKPKQTATKFSEMHVYEIDFSVIACVIARKSRNNRIPRIIGCQRNNIRIRDSV